MTSAQKSTLGSAACGNRPGVQEEEKDSKARDGSLWSSLGCRAQDSRPVTSSPLAACSVSFASSGVARPAQCIEQAPAAGPGGCRLLVQRSTAQWAPLELRPDAAKAISSLSATLHACACGELEGRALNAALKQLKRGSVAAHCGVDARAAASAAATAGAWDALFCLVRALPIRCLRQCPSLLQQCTAAGQHQIMSSLLGSAETLCLDDFALALRDVLQPALVDAAGKACTNLQHSLTAAARRRCAVAEASPSGAKLCAAARAVASVYGFSRHQLPLHAFVAAEGLDRLEIDAACTSLPARAKRRLLRYLVQWLLKLLRSDVQLSGQHSCWCASTECVLS